MTFFRGGGGALKDGEEGGGCFYSPFVGTRHKWVLSLRARVIQATY